MDSSAVPRTSTPYQISAHSMRTLQADVERRFLVRLISFIRREWPVEWADSVKGDEGSEWSVLTALVARARKHGFSHEDAIADFIGIALQTSPHFDEHPDVAALLASTEFVEGERLQALVRLLPPATWTAVRRGA